MEEGIKNKVAESGLINIDPSDFYPKETIAEIDLKNFLFQEMILKEKDFRAELKSMDWTLFKDQMVCLYCSVDAIVPTWAYMLLSSYLVDHASEINYCSRKELIARKMKERIGDIDLEGYRDKRVLINGCSEYEIGPEAYVQLIQRLQGVAKSVMYGEACSSVPVYKRK